MEPAAISPGVHHHALAWQSPVSTMAGTSSRGRLIAKATQARRSLGWACARSPFYRLTGGREIRHDDRHLDYE